ncbi:uncharacterized protein LOC134830580 [Culicoides brevitarsis]|uniref:uncharacterized protein LOC134830580 n=1 Tax=Culicoides brevitarsis TaxID=469753 RepID=UPI00307B54F2
MRDGNKGVIPPKQRFSLGLDLSEYVQDCSIDLCDMSNSSSMPGHNKSSSQNTGGKQNSFEMDESLGILTPEQMKEFLDSTKTNTASHPGNLQLQSHQDMKFNRHQCRLDLTPSPEELPLDPIGVKTDMDGVETDTFPQDMISSLAESDKMTKSAMSKISNSFIASITSVTSDGYQGDGEMSRPASRGADHSPVNGMLNQQENRSNVVSRRQDPMTDSDFFTESDADDNRGGDRRAQVIDGTLFGAKMNAMPVQPVVQQGTMDDSCMESSGVFTDVENRGDDDMSHRLQAPNNNQTADISPDTETQSSSNTQYTEKKRSSILLQQNNNELINNATDEGNEYTHTPSQSSTSSSSLQYDKSATVVDSDNTKAARQSVTNRSSGDTTHATVTASGSASKQQTRKQAITLQRKLEMTPRSLLGNKCKIQKLNSLESEDLSLCSNSTRSTRGSTPLRENVDRDAQKRTKPKSNNKWDAVMNKIAENQKNSSAKKRDFSEVKSKVYCGLVKSPAATKRQLFIAAKHNHEIDRSSQSDLSLDSKSGIQSPKNNQRTTPAKSGAIKKRDVRTLNEVTSSDQTRKNKLDTVINPHAIVQELKSSPPNKKHSSRKISDFSPKQLPKQLDHNRTVGNGPTAGNNVASKQHLSPKPRVTNVSNRTTLPLVTSAKSPEPLTSPHHPHKISQRNATIILESATIIPAKQQQQHSTNNNNIVASSPTVTTKTPTTKSVKKSPIPNNKQQTDRNTHHSVNLKNLKNLSGKIASVVPAAAAVIDDGPSKAQLKQELVHANKGVEALGALMQYLVYHLDAFSCPSIKTAHDLSQKSLRDTTRLLDETRAACQHLEERLGDRENYFKVRETELEAKYQTELQKVREQFIELETSASSRIHALESELSHKETTHVAAMAKLNTDTELRVQVYETQLRNARENEQNLTSRLTELTGKVDELTEKAHSSEIEFSEKIQSLTSQLEKMKADAAAREQELLFELSKKSKGETAINTSSSRVSPEKSMNRSQSTLQDEVESLRCVLDLKQNEIAELRKQNQEMQRAVDDHNSLAMKYASAESRLEDLKVQLQCKIGQEQELLDKIKQLEEKYNQETKTKSRLSQHNEELQYRLKQNSEKFSATLTELSKSLHEHSMCNRNKMNQSLDLSFRSQPGSEQKSLQIDENSPPTSPVVKGVVEKSDSVSWVLEMDDEAPEVLASRVVRRAGSFRSNYLSTSMDKCSQSPVPKRQKCASPLQTSASATSILRRNNSDRSPQKEITFLRSRSKSVTIKTKAETPNPSKKSTAVKNLSMSFQEPRMYTSSPRLDRHIEPEFVEEEVFIEETSPFEVENPIPEHFHRDKTPSFKNSRENRGLITCDTTKLVPSHAKSDKRKPKISAGEALISGSNSEDDTESTDESCGLSSSSSNGDPREVLSIEDALMKKIGVNQHISGSNTPMDVSWSEHIGNDQEPPV